MARTTNRLTARGVATIKAPGMHADGDGLYLKVRSSGTRSWVFVFQGRGKRHEMGLGPLSRVSLAEARQAASILRIKIFEGVDLRVVWTPESFGEAATCVIERLRPGWKSAKHAQQWTSTLKAHRSRLQVAEVPGTRLTYDYPVRPSASGREVLSSLGHMVSVSAWTPRWSLTRQACQTSDNSGTADIAVGYSVSVLVCPKAAIWRRPGCGTVELLAELAT
ncbi:Arm DNA-binding domain-containing protein [Sphingomonas sp. DBB INV C78]|uniref:Arm DNA-binding domain-containing protein n=1 Tax=Sphingomonas sp. DBB INV C78 TaxID=3349434 RepID=UPI0036D3EDF5